MIPEPNQFRSQDVPGVLTFDYCRRKDRQRIKLRRQLLERTGRNNPVIPLAKEIFDNGEKTPELS